MRSTLTSALIVTMGLAFAPSAMAQSAPTEEAVVAACTAGGCAQEISAYATAVRRSLGDAAADQALVDLITLLSQRGVGGQRLADAARAAAGEARSGVTVNGLRRVADASSAIVPDQDDGVVSTSSSRS